MDAERNERGEIIGSMMSEPGRRFVWHDTHERMYKIAKERERTYGQVIDKMFMGVLFLAQMQRGASVNLAEGDLLFPAETNLEELVHEVFPERVEDHRSRVFASSVSTPDPFMEYVLGDLARGRGVTRDAALNHALLFGLYLHQQMDTGKRVIVTMPQGEEAPLVTPLF